VTLELPDRALTVLRLPPEEIVQILRLAAARHWFTRGVIAADKAAEIAGIPHPEFMETVDEGEDADVG
jgi:hypothetical protein